MYTLCNNGGQVQSKAHRAFQHSHYLSPFNFLQSAVYSIITIVIISKLCITQPFPFLFLLHHIHGGMHYINKTRRILDIFVVRHLHSIIRPLV